jgi:hypothetical protein
MGSYLNLRTLRLLLMVSKKYFSIFCTSLFFIQTRHLIVGKLTKTLGSTEFFLKMYKERPIVETIHGFVASPKEELDGTAT